MGDTRQKFREMLNHIAEHDKILRFNKLSEMTGISQNTFTRIKRGEVKEVGIETFWKLNNAFGKRYNVKWFQGDSSYMLMDEYLEAKQNLESDITPDGERQLKITQRAHDIQMSVLGHIVEETKAVEGMAAEDDPHPYIPVWADTLLGILSKQIAENEVLHAELKATISEVKELIKNQNKK